MLDELRRDMQHRLDELLDEAGKLRQALVALGRHEHTTPSTARDGASATRSRGATPPVRQARRATTTAGSAPTASARPARSRTTNGGSTTPRMASGETKRAVMAALGSGNAMTASEIAKATGLGRASVSTTLSKLAKSGEVTKAARGYALAG